MRRPFKHPQAGFSLVEALIVVALLGLLAAVVLPAGHGALARMRVEAATRALVRELERERDQAMRVGRSRRLPLQGDGSLQQRALRHHPAVAVHHNLPAELRVTAHGWLIDGGTLVLASAGTDLQRCLVLSLPLGVMRLGRYSGNPTAGLNSAACQRDAHL